MPEKGAARAAPFSLLRLRVLADDATPGEAGGYKTRLMLILLAGLMLGLPEAATAAGCPERPQCEGCGCKGGPGYRASDGKCVGFKNLEKRCGPFPHAKCTFENAPGTGANRECALDQRPKRKGKGKPAG